MTTRNDQFNIKVDIIKGTGSDHIHLLEQVKYLEEEGIIAGEQTQIDVGDIVYMNDMKYQVIHKRLVGRENHITLKKWN